jgi:hypothetical protein
MELRPAAHQPLNTTPNYKMLRIMTLISALFEINIDEKITDNSNNLQENMGSRNISSSREPFSIIHISERVHGAFLRMRLISSVLINCCRIILEKGREYTGKLTIKHWT